MNQITLGSSIFYSVLAFIVLINCLLGEKTNKVFFVWLNIIILTFVAGFRSYTVGTDTFQYTVIFNNPFYSTTFIKAPLFCYLSYFLMNISNNPTFLFLVYEFIIYGLISLRLWELREYSSYTYSFMFFFCFCFFETMNGLRQYVAVSIIFFGTRYLFEGRYIKYIITILIAYIFHVTALLGFLGIVTELFNCKNIEKKQKRFVVVIIIIGLASSAYVVHYLTNRIESYMHYFNNVVMNVGFRLLALFIIFVFSFFIFDKNRYIVLRKKMDKPGYLLSTTRLYYLYAIVLGSIGYFYPFMERLAWIYILFEGVYFGILVTERKQIRRLLLKIPILFIMLFVLINYLFFKNGSMHHPYIFIWNQ